MTDEELREIINNKTWHFAKSMPKIPHFYARRREWGDDLEFQKVVMHMVKNSQPEKFFTRTYLYFYLDGWKYWIMDKMPNQAQIINRARVDE